jgi:dipeptidyl aminopeptidase/acylaminoacyl peptidase
MRHFACAAALLVSLPTAGAAQEKTIATPPSITVEGIPPIPQSIADGLARYAQFRAAQLLAWHPTKRHMLISTALGPVAQLHFVDGPGRNRHQLTWYARGIGATSAPSFDPADPNTFVFLYDDAGGELKSVYRYDLSTGEASLVSESKTRYAPVWARQGKWLAFDSAERNGKDRDLYVMQPSDPKTKRRLGDFDGPYGPQDWSADGQTLLAAEVVSNQETYLWRVDVKTGAKTAITPRDGQKAAFFNGRFSADGKKVYALSDRSDGEWRIWRCDLANGSWTAVTGEGIIVNGATDLPPGGFEISPDGNLLAVIVDRGSSSELQVIDLATLKPRTLPAIARGTLSQIRWRPGSREIGFTLGSVRAQNDVYSVDVSLGTLTRWTTSETSFNAEVLPPPEVVTWKSFDGQVISGVLYRPAAKFTGPRPVLVQIHGGPDSRDRARWQGRSNYFLNEMGIALLYPNVRGSAGFGRKFSEMDNGKLRGDAVKDIGALLDWIAGRAEFDKNRIVLSGGSYGGWLALQAGITYNDRIRGIIAGAGPTDLVTFLETTDAARQDNRRREFGDERDPDMRAYLKSISPITRASELKKATFLLHPGKDIRVPVEQARELVKALKANDATVWYAEFADAGHDNFPGTAANNDWMLAAWIMFMKTFVVN